MNRFKSANKTIDYSLLTVAEKFSLLNKQKTSFKTLELMEAGAYPNTTRFNTEHKPMDVNDSRITYSSRKSNKRSPIFGKRQKRNIT